MARLTDAQRRLLVEIGDIGSEVFAPNPSTIRALRKRGLIKTRLIGMRWWWIQPTSEGRAACAAVTHRAAERPKCPRCGSPDPMRHPAMQFEGEVQICPDPFHPLTADTITDGQIRELARGALTAAQHKDCSVALSGRRRLVLVGRTLELRRPTARERRAARARCAELINARRSR